MVLFVEILEGIVAAITLPVVAVFFFRLKYISSYGIASMGVYVLLPVLFMIVGGGIITVLASSVSFKQSSLLMEGFILIPEAIIVVFLLKKKYKNLNKTLVLLASVLFLGMWLFEFYNVVSLRDGAIAVNRLKTTQLLLSVAIVGGVLSYLFYLYQKSPNSYVKIPFFWIAIGWLIYYAGTATSLIDEMKNATMNEKENMILFMVFVEIIRDILFIIGFWKTKEWVTNDTMSK